MNSHEFVKSIKEVVEKAAIDDTIEALENPPGRKPDNELILNSEWYKSLDVESKNRVKSIVSDAVGGTVFGLFTVLDGVRSISPAGVENNLELFHSEEQEKTQLNDREKEFLHDIYNNA